jgi:hypothetical protein
METNLQRIEQILLSKVPLQPVDDFYKIETSGTTLTEIQFQLQPEKIILPLREGELIENPEHISIGTQYSLTYPGTASTKCLVLYQEGLNIFIGGIPSYDYTKIALTRVNETSFHLSFVSEDHNYYLIPFASDWKEAVDKYKKQVGIEKQSIPVRKPKYLLQLGVIKPNGEVYIRNLEELVPVIELFHEHFGEGHIIHFFGTNKDGFDRMFPDYTIAPALGGEKSFSKLLQKIKSLNLLSSHHYNPRLADTNWIKLNPSYKQAIVKSNGKEIIEPYAGHLHYVMNLNDEKWYARCFETIDYLADLGFDYLEIDQFVYQRNFYNEEKPLAFGYKRMVEDFIQKGLKFWVEGLSDVFLIPEGNFYQILIRDRSQLWEDGENRRGYPYGRTFADFFMYLWPDTEVSYQIFTEHKLFEKIEERINTARDINTAVYDIELGFYDGLYENNLKRLIKRLKNYGVL